MKKKNDLREKLIEVLEINSIFLIYNFLMKNFDLVIIGSGPSGMNAALYASRMNMSVCIVEKGAPGGKLVYISKIENWLGDKSINGADLALRMKEHIDANGVNQEYGEVIFIDHSNNKVVTSNNEFGYKFLIIASGTSERVPEEIENIERLKGKGVSYCAICDGPLYKDQDVAVIGGGNSAIEEAAYLSSVAKKVHIFVRNKISATHKYIEDLNRKENIIIHEGASIKTIEGDENVSGIKTTIGDFDVNAVFPYIGLIPNTSFVPNKIKNSKGFIEVDKNMQTSIDNIFAVGDVIEKRIRQVSTAVSDGTIAAKVIANKI